MIARGNAATCLDCKVLPPFSIVLCPLHAKAEAYARALGAIQGILDGREWKGAEDLEAIAEHVRAAGLPVREPRRRRAGPGAGLVGLLLVALLGAGCVTTPGERYAVDLWAGGVLMVRCEGAEVDDVARCLERWKATADRSRRP